MEHRARTASGAVFLAALLVSCTVSDDELDSVDETEISSSVGDEKAIPTGAAESASRAPAGEVEAFHFDSGTLELGPFDPYEVYPDVFDPCQEISDQEFAEIGFTTDGITTPFANSSTLSCVLLSSESVRPYGLILAGNLIKKEELSKETLFLNEDVSQTVPGMFLYEQTELEENNCSAAVSTKRGHLIAFSIDTGSTADRKEHCRRAVQILEELSRS